MNNKQKTGQKKKRQETLITKAHLEHEKAMNSYASFKLSNSATGQDLVQDTFMKTWSYLVKGGKVHLMKPFLYHILNQLIIDEYRKRKTYSLDALREKGFEPSFDQTEKVINSRDGDAVLLLIQDLPPKYERVMRMRYVEGLSLKEISQATGQSRNTVAVQAHRGLAKLKKLYNNK